MTLLTKTNEWKALNAIANFGKPVLPSEFAKVMRYRDPRNSAKYKGSKLADNMYTRAQTGARRLTHLVKLGYLVIMNINYKHRYWLTELGVNRLFEYDTDPDVKEYLRRLERGY